MKTDKPKQRRANQLAQAGAGRASAIPAPKPQAARKAGSENPVSAERVTEIAAKVNVGWGNALFIRGEGDGLSWEKGTPLVCADSSTWVWSTSQAKRNIVFKLLLNDRIWAGGADAVVEPGRRLEIVPTFQQPAG